MRQQGASSAAAIICSPDALAVVVLLGAALLAASACDLDDSARTTSQAVIGGEPAPGDDAVVALRLRTLACGVEAGPIAGIGAPICTGTLISPTVVLTAAHCVDTLSAAVLEVFVGANVATPGEIYYVDDVRVHPGWSPPSLANDIAMLRLQASAGAGAPLLSAMDDGYVGTTARIVGFGVAVAGDLDSAGVRRSGAATIDAVLPQTFDIIPAPAMSCAADSGGPLFVDNEGSEFLAGITSFGDVACAELGVNTRVDAYRASFLAPYLAEAAARGPALAGPARDEPIEICTETCASDNDCPEHTVCSPYEGESRCAFPGLPPGSFAEPCAENSDCASAGCIATNVAGQPVCRCYDTCAGPPDAGSQRPEVHGGGGCALGSGDESGGAGMALLMVLALLRLMLTRRRGSRSRLGAPAA